MQINFVSGTARADKRVSLTLGDSAAKDAVSSVAAQEAAVPQEPRLDLFV